ncbi:MAG TPA: hypothetical protein VJ784_04305 [Pyrinomonadaceae bacterium]|jgi:hypothetical protein|nr:hypothetical protein [Pyrinomonadaceae bacterium]
MSKFLLLIACVLIGLLVLACGAPTNRNASAPSTVSSGEKVGIAECDNFIAAYETCVNSKVEEAARANVRASVTRLRTDWKKMADDPQMRATLAAHCKAQRETTMATMKSYNCTW